MILRAKVLLPDRTPSGAIFECTDAVGQILLLSGAVERLDEADPPKRLRGRPKKTYETAVLTAE